MAYETISQNKVLQPGTNFFDGYRTKYLFVKFRIGHQYKLSDTPVTAVKALF